MADFLLEIGAEEIPDWMIDAALADLREQLSSVHSGHSADRRYVDGSHAAAAGLAGEGSDGASARRRNGCCRARMFRRATKAAAGIRTKTGHDGRATWRRMQTRRASATSFISSQRASRPLELLREKLPDIIAGIHLAEDDVLDRQGRRSLYPADSLDRGAAGRSSRSV